MGREVEVRVLVAFFTLSLLLSAPAAAIADEPSPTVSHVGGTVQGKAATVSFRLRHAFSPEMVEALKSGIDISFRIRVEVERVHRNWFNTTVGEMQFTQSVRYDVLSRVYRLSGLGRLEILPDLQQVLDRMTHYEVTVPLTAGVERGKPYRANVRARLDRAGLSEPLRSIVFFSSMWDVETGWARGPLKAP